MLKGLDVSNWQGVINWPQVKADGYQFAIVKATEGRNIVDADFAANWAGAKAVGLVRGAYCFTRPEQGDPEAQAAYFVQTVGAWEPGDLAAGDFETPGGASDESAFALAWLGNVAKAIGFDPLVYCAEYWASSRLKDPRMAEYPLWLACLDPEALPASIGVWKSVALQQNSWTIQVPGIGGNVDGDQLARTVAGLKALGKPNPVKATPAHVKAPCGLKPGPIPSHASKALIQIPGPPKGICVDTGERQTVGADVWAEIIFTDLTGWILASNLAPN